VVDHGDGTYSATLTAGFTPGTDVFRIVVQHETGQAGGELRPVTLYPFPTLEVE
jgi:hypothetical protein